MRISIVTPSLNQGRFIERTIRSVLEQTGEFELEYRVQDGGSTDGTLEMLRRYEGRLHWASEPDRGPADAINKGLARATGEVLAWLNSDDTYCPGALARVAALFHSRPDLLWLHGRCQIVDEQDRPIRSLISSYKHRLSLRYSYRRLLTENFISQMTVFWRREALDRLGAPPLLDTQLQLAFDYDLWLRLGRLGAPAYIARPTACFRWRPDSLSGARFERQFEEDFQVSCRYAGRQRSLLWLKRWRSARIVWVYRALGWLGRRRKKSSGAPAGERKER
jgi:glycosyltransferase involved in cell wall biosynthesis